VYTISNAVLIIYFLAPQSIYEFPGFESVSWNTAVGFLIYVSTMLSNYHESLLQELNLPEDLPLINKKFVDFWFNLSFLSPIVIIIVISLLHFFGVVSSKVGMGISLFFVCLLPFPITYFFYKETVSWSIKIYQKNRKIFLRDEDILFHNQLLQEFAQITSHNLRGPIVSLSNLTKLALDDDTSEDITKRSFELLEEKLPSLVTTVDSLADFYNMIKTGEIAYQTCDFREIFEEVLIDCKNTNDADELSLNIEFDLNVPTVEYPNIYIRNLLYNLVSNSIKYRKKEGPLNLVLKTEPIESEGLELSFKDNGSGMDLKYFKKHIFKFGKSYHNFSNSKGIGLFIVKNQLARLGDTIDVYSKEGEYTEFIIKLNYHGKKELGYS
jgi:signal transduction histidine kinase